MRVHWTQNAVGHLVSIYEYIAGNSPIYAQKMVDRITRRSEQIAEQPLSGRRVPEYDADDIRELIEKPYRIIYKKVCTGSLELQGYGYGRALNAHGRNPT